jgi:flagellar hook-associated protein 3 FlgL
MNVSAASIGSDWFLEGLSTLERQQVTTERQISSGYQIEDASDSPSQAGELVDLGSSLAVSQTYQENLTSVQGEANAADQAIGSAISLIENATSIASQSANSISTASARKSAASEVQSIQQQIVALANTTFDGRYIFGGDQDRSAPYQIDASSANGVDQLTTQSSTRVITNPEGNSVYQGLTAAQIFDPKDASGNAAAGNAFAALQSLATALNANDQNGIQSALTSLQSVSDYLNQQQAANGTGQARITSEQNNVANQITDLQTRIANIRDTNVAQAATDLTQEQTDLQAAMASQAEMPSKTLFDYLG